MSDDKYRSTATKVLSSVYQASSDFADAHQGQNRGAAAGTAAALLSMGIDRVNRTGKSASRSGSLDLDYTDEQLEHIRQMASSAEENELKKHRDHFVDKLMDKMLKYTIPDDSPDKAIFEQKINDPSRSERPNLSIRILLSNFKKLAGKMGMFFELQYGIIHIITWRKPTKTLTALVLYTTICLWPHLVVTYPLIFLLFGIIVPGYLHRHPMRTPELIKVKKRGQSLFSFLNEGAGEHSIIDDLLSDSVLGDEGLRPTFSGSEESSDVLQISPSEVISETSVSTDDSKKPIAKSQLALLINMRDLQNLTTDLLNGMDLAEKSWFETFGFKDEHLSTFIFYGVAAATSVVLFLGQFIPWRLIFIQSGWAGILLCHPKSKTFLVELSNAKKARAAKAPQPEEIIESEVKKFETNDIIVDDAPERRIVEIFELQKKSILHEKWTFYSYSGNIFDTKKKTRLAGKRPGGVDHLSKVVPPKDWLFDFGFANKWTIDYEPQEFLRQRSLESKNLVIREGEKSGWIYDKDVESQSSDITYEFRRRRLYRECLRYGRAPKGSRKS
ncbi:predicted protein [Scheffersomyces stipitis CBS 6054]|uniref:TECPR1-like DysF domain-containing protein n=1 Tax=Scheffersomyces stipitis (strain ATCC 58785 / CBS 6054 / NBRC 10063 / NRRL Y-11545) TaxID=322104 RepID=A3GHG6_PICST|nr:predicted protein [Scheffersomyces stipitis CBS 6054]EAZ62814.2 predicted protein [Scheffersomyces stipitis CBS 6054]KAG2735804.1 hypothetical protein G9P44_002018 [Scheffersomyces stipitis]